MRPLALTLLLLFFGGHLSLAAPVKDPHLDALFERLEQAPPEERRTIRREIRHYLRTQKRIERRDQLERMRRECEMRNERPRGGGRGYGPPPFAPKTPPTAPAADTPAESLSGSPR